jgi:hypothetical protein
MSDVTSESSPAAPAAAAAPAAGGTTPGTPRLVTVHGVNWENVLEFAHLFRGFRLAINPAKLAVALLAILLIYVAGWLFDFAWGPQVYAGEMQHFVSDSPETYRDLRTNSLANRNTFFKGNPAATYAEFKASYKKEFEDAVEAAQQRRLKAEAAATSADPFTHINVSVRTPAEIEQESRQVAADTLMRKMGQLNDVWGKGIFQTFLKYETDQFDGMVDNTLTFVRVTPVAAPYGNAGIPGQAVSGGLLSRDPDRLWRSDTVLGCIANMTITAPRWLFTGTAPMQWRPDHADTAGGWLKLMVYRALYLASLIALAVFSLLMLALAGASIARLSALELAGIERAPLRDVFFFTIRRLWVFVKAPVTPFLILLAIGLVMALVSMLGAVPYIGPIVLGLVFFAFLGVSFVLMLLLLGILGGFNLLYPTIAVEGADSFDAMSRSFAYVYARPWRLLVYTVTSLIYGVVTFLFVSFAVFLILFLTHTFVGWGMNLFGAHDGALSGLPALETIWPEPQFLRLVSPTNWYVMSWPEFIGSLLLHFWVFLLITGIGAYVISYYFSSHTIIYLLLRRSVDGQNIREVYLEEKGK